MTNKILRTVRNSAALIWEVRLSVGE